jgi:hypothetical protein
MFEEWKFDKILDVQKRITKRLKNRITREYKKAIAPSNENEAESNQVIVPGENLTLNAQTFQIKWELYIEDIIKLIELAELRQRIRVSIEYAVIFFKSKSFLRFR